jgi:hypothetical protein
MSIPYTYLIGWSTQNKWYYGCQYHGKSDPKDLWSHYFTSSEAVKSFREEHGEPDQILVCETFDTALEAKQWEEEVLLAIPKEHRKLYWLNIQFGTLKNIVMTEDMARRMVATKAKKREIDPTYGTTTGYTNEYRVEHGMKTIPGKPKGSKEKESTRKKKSETRRGKCTYKNKEGNCIICSPNDPRVLSGEYWAVNRGYKRSPMTEETKLKIGESCVGRKPWNYGLTKDDPRVAKYIEKSAISKKENAKNKPRKILGNNVPKCTCVVCKKETNSIGLVRFHKH